MSTAGSMGMEAKQGAAMRCSAAWQLCEELTHRDPHAIDA